MTPEHHCWSQGLSVLPALQALQMHLQMHSVARALAAWASVSACMTSCSCLRCGTCKAQTVEILHCLE